MEANSLPKSSQNPSKSRFKQLQKTTNKKRKIGGQQPVSVREREARYISVTSRKVGKTPASPENNNRFAHHGIPTTS